MNGSTRRHSTDTRNISIHDGKSFTMRSYEIRARNFLRMCSYKSLDLKSFGFCTYEKRVGGGGGLAHQPSQPCWSTPAMRRVVVLGAGFGGPLATIELDRIYRGRPVTALCARIAVRKGDPRCHPSGK